MTEAEVMSVALPLELPTAAELRSMLTVVEADCVLQSECPGAKDYSLSEIALIRRTRRNGEPVERLYRKCQAVLLFKGDAGGINVVGVDWNDVLDEVRRQYEGPTRRNA